ncbi:hypothetical protein QP888_05110, partial [Corynebacterium sp. MSK297]
MSEVYWVLFLGIYLIFHYFPGLILFPKPDFNLDRGSVPQALVESGFIPPIHPLKRRDLHLDNVIPPVRLPSFSGHPINADLVSVREDAHCES